MVKRHIVSLVKWSLLFFIISLPSMIYIGNVSEWGLEDRDCYDEHNNKIKELTCETKVIKENVIIYIISGLITIFTGAWIVLGGFILILTKGEDW